MKLSSTIHYHSLVLIACSQVGFWGFYFQHERFQFTALIPAFIGLLLLLLSRLKWRHANLQYVVLLLITIVFGIILTRMSIKFFFEDFQPLRKRIYFPVMAISSIMAGASLIVGHNINRR